MADRLQAAVVGGSGYVGGELVRLLLGHPSVELAAVTSRRHAGRPLFKALPHLRGTTDLKFTAPDDLGTYDVMFLALPHGESLGAIDDYASRAEYLIDLSSDFRLRDPEVYESYYGQAHPRSELLEAFVYGLPELHRDELRGASHAAVPGCTATAAILPLAPIVEAFDVQTVVVDAKVGSSASGASVSAASHHPERTGVVRPFKPTGHRHTAEMVQELSPEGTTSVNFSPHAVELVRGIASTAHVFLDDDVAEKEIWTTYRAAYGEEPFVRFVKERSGLYRYPEPKLVEGTNYCDIGFELDERTGRLVVMSAIDNLTKGAAGQAVQCLNLMAGFDERDGLDAIGLYPV